MEIRSYRDDDALETELLFIRAVRETAIGDYTQSQVEAWAPTPPDPASWGAKRTSRPTWVATEGEGIVGFTDLLPDGHIDMMFVHPEFTRRGIASALLDVVVAEARSRGLLALTTDGSITAKPFFEAHGFVVVTPQLAQRPDQTLRNFRMCLELGGCGP